MSKVTDLISRERTQYRVLSGLSVAVLGLTGTLYRYDAAVFRRFLGEVNPLLVIFLIVVLGAILLSVLLSRGWFAIYKYENRKGLYLAFGLAALFGAVMILVDSRVRFPEDLNILFPGSLLFYPAIGYLVEVLFHVLPLALLLVSTAATAMDANREKIVTMSIVFVAFLEPLYQTVCIGYPERLPFWAQAYVGLHVFLINVAQLFIFRKYDFVSMYLFRLAYYLVWHIGWGYVRLRVLFG